MSPRRPSPFSARTISAALAHLRGADPVMRELIDRVGPFRLQLEPDPFRMLVRSIISQQISTRAARAIRERLEARVGTPEITAGALLALGPEELRAVGLSARKAEYLLDLSARVADGRLRPERLHQCPDDEVIRELTAVRGIGVWTAQMLLIFCLGRPDVLPEDDYGVRAAIRNLYGLPDLPTRARCREVAAPWRPWASVASWYCWRSLDNEPPLK